MNNFDVYKKVQSIAKETMAYLSSVIVPGISEREIRDSAERYMLSRGVESFWYYDVGAFVFVGERTALSVSGRHYVASEQKVGESDLVTVDLSPCIGKAWGDYARSFVIGNADLTDGVDFQKYLHRYLSENIKPEMTCDELYHEMNREIESHGFRNADFNRNLGHTIEEEKEKRRYIENGNEVRIKDVGLFTFEPHILKNGRGYGFKMENIYYLEGSVLKEL
ncbi:MAG: M24 family metallopeptidase [Spirochaetota bacterium]